MECDKKLVVIGGGLAGCEAAFQAAERDVFVYLYEMRPQKMTAAHVTGHLAELVCSNSLGSTLIDRASGLLKEEQRRLGSLCVQVAEQCAVPAGDALAVDRELFSTRIEERILSHPNIQVIREEISQIPTDITTIIASGPLSSEGLLSNINQLTGEGNLSFFDAIAPVISYESIDFSKAFRFSRQTRGKINHGDGVGDYVNCPLSKEEYEVFIDALVKAERIPLQPFELEIDEGLQTGKQVFFESCLPVEVMATRGKDTLAFGPMRPIGIINPFTGKRPWAVLQLRQDNLAATLYNMVGFQTNLKFPEQKRVFRMIPGLENAEFIRYGQMHRNAFISSPGILNASLQMIQRPHIFFAGQISGVEGYMGNIASGLAAGINAARKINNQPLQIWPIETMTGALLNYVVNSAKRYFQPMKANFGILPPLESPARGKRERALQYAERSLSFFKLM